MITKNKVSVFVGGAQKSGTRSIAQYLRNHPQIAVHRTKEGHFFDRPYNFEGVKTIQQALMEYHDGFEGSSKYDIKCDITPDYLFREGAVERIYHYNPKAVWIILLRNPIERAYSSWNMEVNRETEKFTFEDALDKELKGDPRNELEDRFLYIGRSRYYKQIKNLWTFFPKNQCIILPAEKVWQYPEASLKKIFNKISLPLNLGLNYKHKHKGVYSSSISQNARLTLKEELSFELNDLYSFLGWDENPWSEL